MTVPTRSKPTLRSGGSGRTGSDDELEQAEALAVANMSYLADRHQAEGHPEPEPGPAYTPPDYGTMTGTLICRICQREIRAHTVGEWHR